MVVMLRKKQVRYRIEVEGTSGAVNDLGTEALVVGHVLIGQHGAVHGDIVCGALLLAVHQIAAAL